MFSTTNLVRITRQRSSSQFPGAIYMIWLSRGGKSADHTLAQFYSSSHTLFSMQKRPRQKVGRSGAPCYIPRGPQHSLWGALALLKEKPGNRLTFTKLLSFHFLSVMALHIPDTNGLLLYWKKRDWTGCIHLPEDTNTAGWKTALDLHPEASFKPTTQSMNGISRSHSRDSRSWGQS